MRTTVCKALALAPLWFASACSGVYFMDNEAVLEELDGLVRLEGAGAQRRVVYTADAAASGVVQENTGAYVRELVMALPGTMEDGWIYRQSLVARARGCSRLLWLAELDENPLTRIYALDGLSRLCVQLTLPLFEGDLGASTAPLDAAAAERAREVLREAAAAGRGADGALPAPQAFKEALASLTSQPLSSYVDRHVLVEDLTALVESEPDPAGRAWAEASLRSAIGHGVRGALLRAVQGRTRRLAVVRLAAMEQIRRLGGPRTVPLLLAAMAASPAEQQAGLPAFDTDTLVKLRLIHYCGQLGPDLRKAVVRLPGRQDWEATSPVEFLARTILSERAYYSQLRTPALVALTWSLGRPQLDPDPAWVRAWLDQGER
jgi:hypothetical protein